MRPPEPKRPTDLAARAIGEPERLVGDRLIGDALVNYSSLLVGVVVGLLLVPLMLDALGHDQYGLWIAALTLAATLRAIDFGLGLVVAREVAASTGTGLHRRTAPLVSAAGGAHLLLGAVGAMLLIGGALVVAEPLRLPAEHRDKVLPAFACFGVAFIAEQWIGFVSAILTGQRDYPTLNLLNIALVLLRGVGVAVLLLAGQGLLEVAVWHAAATLSVGALAYAILRRTPGGYRVGLPGRHWRALYRHLPFGFASFASVATAGVVWQALPLAAAVLLGAGAVVTVHVGQKIPLVLTGLYARVAAVVFPAASEYQRTEDAASSRAVLGTGTRLVLHMMLPVTVVGVFAAPDILRFWIGYADPQIVLVLRLTLVAVLADAVGSVAINVLWGRGRVTPVLVAAAASAAAVVVGCVALLPWLGVAAGAALLGVVLGTASLGFWIAACRACATPPLEFAARTLEGMALPAAASIGACALVLAIPGPGGFARFVLAGAATAGAYLWLLARTGSTPDERAFLARAGAGLGAAALRSGRWIGARSAALRSLGYLALSLRAIARSPTRELTDEYQRTFIARHDPWGYHDPAHQERIQAALDEVEAVLRRSGAASFGSALEIGCAEGIVTERLAPLCRRLVAADLSAVALARCAERCAGLPMVELQLADFARARQLGPFDLVVAMDVLECIRAPSALRAARDDAVAALAPGGHLVVTTTRQHPVPESAWWGRWLPIGARINEFVGRHPGLRQVSQRTTSTHAISVFRRES